jgi:hypothetical protein
MVWARQTASRLEVEQFGTSSHQEKQRDGDASE